MLTEDFFIKCSDRVTELYNKFTDSIIEKMAYEIKALGDIEDINRQAMVALSAGEVYDDMIAKLSDLTRYSKEEIKSLLKEAGETTLNYDDKIYKRAGFNPGPINQSPVMLQIMASIAESTNSNLYNLVKTSATHTSALFMDTLNEALMQVSTGAFDYNTAITRAIKKLATYGTIINYPSGAKAQLDTVVRRAVLTGVSNATTKMQLERANEFGAPYADTSAHAGARPTHAEWQGKRFRLSDAPGVNMEYPHFLNEPFGTENKPVIEQLDDPNCRHSWYPVMFDEEAHAYSQKEIDKINNQKVHHDGKEYTVYEAEQRLRQMERTVRKYRRQTNALKENGLDYSFELNKARYWQAKINDFVYSTGLQRRYVNEKVYY